MINVAVIGGGASGIMAALTAAEDKNNSVTLLERQQRVGRKLLATGNGRCNLTNMGACIENYHGEQSDFAETALSSFPPEKTLEFFRGLGLLTVTEPGGRVYPLSDSANSVLDVLRFALEKRGVKLRTACPAGLDIMNDLEGNHVAVSVKRKLAMRAGETDKAVTVDNAEIRQIGAVIGQNLKHIGNLDCDILERDGAFYVLELNPRFGGGYPFSYEAGVNMPKALIEWAQGHEVNPDILKPVYGKTFAKCDYLVER